jgi:hypothetical protein
MNEKCFPTDKVVVACSGPSLRNVDVFSLGLPVVAISTAIRYIHNPHIWIFADKLNELHGEEGQKAAYNSDILKFVPVNKDMVSMINTIKCNYRSSNKTNYLERDLFTDNADFIRGPHKSITFAIQILHYLGVKTLIFAGNDLAANKVEEKYAYTSTQKDIKKGSNYLKSLNQVETALKEWYPYAKKRGFEWYSWKSGLVFEKIVPQFDEKSIEITNKKYEFDFNCIQSMMRVSYVSSPTRPIIKRNAPKILKTKIIQKEKAIQKEKTVDLLQLRLIEEKKRKKEINNNTRKQKVVTKEERLEIHKQIIMDRRKIRQMKLEKARKRIP